MTGNSQLTVDVSPLVEALQLAARVTTQGMRRVVANAGVRLVFGSRSDGVVGAMRRTPYVEIERIDSELEEVDHVSGPKTNFGKANNLGGLTWTKGMMIAMQRTNPNSPYSLSTDNRWPLAYAGGLKGAARWRFFADAAERMKISRHSSTHFLQRGWKDAGLQAMGAARAARGVVVDVPATVEVVGEEKGNTELGRASESIGTHTYSLTLENLIGTGLVYPNLSTKRNNALIEHGTGPLQEAISEVAGAMNSRYLPRLQAAIEREWNKIK